MPIHLPSPLQFNPMTLVHEKSHISITYQAASR